MPIAIWCDCAATAVGKDLRWSEMSAGWIAATFLQAAVIVGYVSWRVYTRYSEYDRDTYNRETDATMGRRGTPDAQYRPGPMSGYQRAPPPPRPAPRPPAPPRPMAPQQPMANPRGYWGGRASAPPPPAPAPMPMPVPVPMPQQPALVYANAI